MTAQLEREIQDYEAGFMDADDATRLFQELVDTGFVWHLSERYQRVANALLEARIIFPARDDEAALEAGDDAFVDPAFLLLEPQDKEGTARVG